ncbi:hypothetical protein KGQ55_02840 [Patescibacteria group bacterium]|nr:hypothetical protein [Patescibacteria group bacterium]
METDPLALHLQEEAEGWPDRFAAFLSRACLGHPLAAFGTGIFLVLLLVVYAAST